MKDKFLSLLRNYLAPLSEAERNEILDFYEERFETGMQYEGKTAADIVAELESPEAIARNVLRAYGHTTSLNPNDDTGLRAWPIVGVLLFDLFVAIWLVPALFGIIVGFGGAFLGLIVGAFGALFVGSMVESVWQTVFLLGFSFLWLMLVLWLYDLGIGFVNWLIRIHMQAFKIGSLERVDQAFKSLRVEQWMNRIPTLRRIRNSLGLIAVAFVMVGGVMSVSQLGLGALSIGEPLEEVSDSIDVEADVAANQPWDIVTEMDLGDVRVVRTAGTEILVTSLEHSQAPVTITFDQDNHTLRIENSFSGRIGFVNFFSFGAFRRAGVVIEIPDNLDLRTLDIESTTGRIDIRGFDLEDLDIKVTTGSVTLRDLIVSDTFIVRATTGSITLRNVEGDHLDLRTTTGSINVSQSTLDQATLRVTTGSIEVKNIHSASDPAPLLSAVTTTGSIKLENVYILDVTLTTTTGSIQYHNSDDTFRADRIRANTNTGSTNVTVQERP